VLIPERGDRKGLAVLVVEDDADSAVSLSTLLRLLGHRVEIAFDGPSAVRLAGERLPDVVLLDISLKGGMDGWEVATRLKGLPGPRRPLLVAITGLAQPEDWERSERAGIDLHLVKPADPDLLARTLKRFQAIVRD